MKERELAELLIQMGVNSGIEIERAAEELALVSFPAFVNARVFKSSLLEAIEMQMRLQMEQRLQEMRQKFDTPGSWRGAAVAQPQQPASAPAQPSMPVQPPPNVVTRSVPQDVGAMDTIVGDMRDNDEGTPDATIVWSPRRD